MLVTFITTCRERTMKSIPVVAVITVLLLPGCDPAPSDPAAGWAGTMDSLPNGLVHVVNPEHGMWSDGDPHAWRLTHDLRIGAVDGTAPDAFGEIGSFDVDTLGRIYILDRQARDIRVFNAAGHHVRTIGRAGEGPGELGAPTGLAIAGERIWVVDPGNGRYTVFDTAGAFVTAHPRSIFASVFPWFGGVDAEGRLLDMAFDPRALILIDSDGTPLDTIPLPTADASPPTFPFVDATGQARGFRFVPYTPRFQMALDPERGIWFGMPSEYRFYLQSPAGDTARMVERPYRPVAIGRAELADALEGLDQFAQQGGRVDRSLIPTQRPAYEAMFVSDSGYVWTLTASASGEEGHNFDVFDAEGRYLGSVWSDVALSTRLRPIVRGDLVYAVAVDPLEVPYLVRMRISTAGH